MQCLRRRSLECLAERPADKVRGVDVELVSLESDEQRVGVLAGEGRQVGGKRAEERHLVRLVVQHGKRQRSLLQLLVAAADPRKRVVALCKRTACTFYCVPTSVCRST